MSYRVGSRDSLLAVAQAELAMRAIGDCTLFTMKSRGDRILDKPLAAVGGRGLFVQELDEALLAGRIDLAVHSLKDLPMEQDERLPLVAVLPRGDARDALVLPQGATELDPTKPIGTSSPRRAAQLRALFPAFRIAPVRGNVPTRLQKLDRGGFCALVLAAAGLERLGLAGRITRRFAPEELLPAAGQGIIAIQAGPHIDPAPLSHVNDPDAWDCALAERAFVRAIGGGCTDPIAAYATVCGEKLTLTGLLARGKLCRAAVTGNRADAALLGAALARKVEAMTYE